MVLSIIPAVRTLLIAIGASVALAAGCAGGGGGGPAGRPSVVATTTQAADLARHVAGDRAEVKGILAPNSDPHDYEVRPGDVKALVDADLVIRSGGEVDAWLGGAIDSAGTDAPVLTLLDAAGAEGEDPHWWQDPRRAERAVTAIGVALAKADPAGAAAYRQRADAYRRDLRSLDTAVARCVEEIPPQRRKLVTTHDALGYYARRYGLQVIGTVIPALSTQAQASSGDLARLVDTIRREQVKAIFAESSVNAKVEDAIAQETGARVGRALWADSLGPKGSSGATYADSIRSNTAAIVEGLSGGERSCTLPR
jgi:zinc/manganese transport system substrate-binding protein/manganese/iron transport system substrate-binding protein